MIYYNTYFLFCQDKYKRFKIKERNIMPMNENEWSMPTPLRSDKSDLIHYPANALPPILRDMTLAIAESTSTDIAMAGTALISSISYCFSGVYRMSGKYDHTEPLVIDALTIAEPSFKKSPVISAIKRPYVQFTYDWNEQNKTDIFRCQAERKILESQLLALEKKNDVTADEIANLKTKISNIQDNNFRRIAVDDVTPEALVRLLYDNKSLLMISDEAGMLGNFNGRYSNNIPNLDLILKSYNGETYISDRVGRDSITLKRPYVSICLACQPYVFDSMINNTAFRGSGLISRLIYCFPSSNIGQRKYDTQPIPKNIAENYQHLIYRLLHKKFTYYDENETYLHFDSKAFKEFVDYYNNFIEKNLLTEMAFCRDWGGKYHGLILRICGIIHCVKCELDDKNPAEVHVNLDTLCSSIDIANYYREQAIFAYGQSDIDIGTVKAEKVIEKIKSKNIYKIRQNDLYRICRCTLFKNAQDFNETAEMLEEYGYIRRETVKGANGNNKSGIMIYINPNI
ncbi:MAG: DUF3987 domain-containing protein [Ruminococcus sp.]|nr:DUF3987 domain-containing protein [Ruminococcus sp.]